MPNVPAPRDSRGLAPAFSPPGENEDRKKVVRLTQNQRLRVTPVSRCGS